MIALGKVHFDNLGAIGLNIRKFQKISADCAGVFNFLSFQVQSRVPSLSLMSYRGYQNSIY